MQENPNIWLVDDDPSIIHIVQQAFERQQLSCQIKVFANAQDIITTLAQMVYAG